MRYNSGFNVYDAIGNPTQYENGNTFYFTWENGRQLASGTKGNTSFAYTYNADGLRTKKVVGNTTTTYYWAGTQLVAMTVDDGTTPKTLKFYYDAEGRPFCFDLDGEIYFYITNLQGDVMQIVSESGSVYGWYEYDAWGKLLTLDGSSSSIAEALSLNPLRYRGYIYDSETEFYYLQSRYYDPAVGRFINADDIAYLGAGGLTSYNLFAYCGNNPVMGYDPYGTFDFLGFAKGVGRIVTGIAAVAAGVAVCVAGAPVAMIAVAAVTITAGVLTAVNGAADIQQSVTGNNFVRDTVFNGNQTAYDVYSGVTETVAAVGTAVCGNYLSTNCTMKGAVPGTEGKVTLEPGTTLDRYGSQYGRYLTDPGTPINQLALTPGNSCNLTTYVVNRPFTFRTGVVAPCAWGPGGGVQYFSWMSVQRLVQFGFLTPIG